MSEDTGEGMTAFDVTHRRFAQNDPPPTKSPVPPETDLPIDDIDPDDVPATPPVEPPPVPIRDPRPEGAPQGPYVVG